MKKILLSLATATGYGSSSSLHALPPPPTLLKQYHQIVACHQVGLDQCYNELSPQERIFAYFLFRASLPGSRIIADQNHRHAMTLIEFFETLYNNRELLATGDASTFSVACITEIETYLVFLWANQGHYFKHEHERNKRTPAALGLNTITSELLQCAVSLINRSGTATIELLSADAQRSLFDEAYEQTMTVADSIEQSAVNSYAPNFTQKEYDALTAEHRAHANAYFYVDTAGKPQRELYCVQGRCSPEMSVASYWLKKAYQYAKEHPAHFDKELVMSLDYLISYLQTGDDVFFRQHSIAWLQSKSRVDYNFGFIEVYKDPKQVRGYFQAEATIKAVSLESLNKILPAIEKQIPVDPAYRRENMQALPNASINIQLFGTGDLGPMNGVAAYCLPNDSEIRSTVGSKQIIYASEKGLAARINQPLMLQLFFSKKEGEWLSAHDPHLELLGKIRNILVILHETVGHGSGRLAHHTFVDGDLMTIGGKTYRQGDTVQVTSATISEHLAGYESAIEELRAEIIALYVALHHYDELVGQGLLGSFAHTITRQEVEQWLLQAMLSGGLKWMLKQPAGATEISGDHALADTTIMHYLMDHGGVKLLIEERIVDGKTYQVPYCKVLDMVAAKRAVTQLMQKVQAIKSTGDGKGAKKLIDSYGKPIRDQKIMQMMQHNWRSIVGPIRGIVLLYPLYKPQYDATTGTIVDVSASWPRDIIEQQYHWRQRALSVSED